MKKKGEKILLRYWMLLGGLMLIFSIDPTSSIAIEQGQPLTGVSFIESVSQDRQSALIDEYRYQLTSKTRFYTQDGKPTSQDIFTKGLLVEFVADDKGELLSLREEFDLEGEFAQKRTGQHNVSVSPDISKQREQSPIKKKNTLHLENGIWKN